MINICTCIRSFVWYFVDVSSLVIRSFIRDFNIERCLHDTHKHIIHSLIHSSVRYDGWMDVLPCTFIHSFIHSLTHPFILSINKSIILSFLWFIDLLLNFKSSQICNLDWITIVEDGRKRRSYSGKKLPFQANNRNKIYFYTMFST